MQLSELTLKLLFLFFPGIIAYIIVNNLTEHKEKTPLDFLVQSFVLGVMSYFSLYVLKYIAEIFVKLINWLTNLRLNWAINTKLTFFDCLSAKQTSFDFWEILGATLLGLMLSVIITYCINKGILHTCAQHFDITKKFSSIDVWQHVFNQPNAEWVLVRDREKDLMYEGWVAAFSSTSRESELFLKGVKVYCDSTGNPLYDLDGLYLSRDNKNLTLEFREMK